METKVSKTDVKVDFRGDTSIKNIMQTTIKALKHAHQEKLAVEFQIEAVSGNKSFMDVVESYVVVVA